MVVFIKKCAGFAGTRVAPQIHRAFPLESHKCQLDSCESRGAPDYLKIPNEDTGVNPFRPDYDLVCSRFGAWLFLHKPGSQTKRLQ